MLCIKRKVCLTFVWLLNIKGVSKGLVCYKATIVDFPSLIELHFSPTHREQLSDWNTSLILLHVPWNNLALQLVPKLQHQHPVFSQNIQCHLIQRYRVGFRKVTWIFKKIKKCHEISNETQCCRENGRNLILRKTNLVCLLKEAISDCFHCQI